MNIGFDFRMGGTQHGGIGRYCSELLFAMLEADTQDKFFVFHNDSISESDLEQLDKHLHVELVRVPARHYSLAEQTMFLRELNKQPLDVIHFPNFNHPIWYRKPFVVTVHDMVHHKISGHKPTHYFHFKAYQTVMKHAVEQSRAIITPSEASKKDIAEYFPASREKISVVYEGVTLKAQDDALVQKVKKQFLLNRPYFLFVGTLERKKNIAGLAQGFDKLIEKYNLGVDLVFAGKPDVHYPEEKYKALSIKHRDHLIFTGYVEDDVLAALYQGAHAYANASSNEGFGLPGVEAMRFGIPLAVANSPVFNEVYDNAAVYFDPNSPDDIAEKLRLLATDRQFYEQQQEKAIARGRLFSWDRAARETLEILKTAAGKPHEVTVRQDLVAETT